MSQTEIKKCLLILGMHRSGTSALSGALHMAGMDIGRSVMPPKEDNPLGFFENDKITALNDLILYDLYSRWNDTTLIPGNWWNDVLFETHRQKFIQILKKDFAGERDILVKDPRISVLLPFYLDILKSLNTRPVFLVCTRDPVEVTASLVKRNHLSPEKIQLLWMDYELKAEYHSRNYARMFVAYRDFLENPITFLEKAKALFGLKIDLEDDKRKLILQFVSKTLSHHRSSTTIQNEYCHEEVPKLHTILSEASGRDLSMEEISAVDQIRAGFNSNFHFYNGLASTFKAKLIILDRKGAHRIIEQEVGFGLNSFRADLGSGNELSEILLLPCNARVGLQIVDISLTDVEGNKNNLVKWSSNAEYEYEDKTLVFEVEMPHIKIDLKQFSKPAEITINLRYLSFGRIAYRMGTIIQSDLIEELLSEIYAEDLQGQKMRSKKQRFGSEVRKLAAELVQSKKKIAKLNWEMSQKNKEIASLSLESIQLKNSLTWITGKIITCPFRMIYDLVYKKK